MPSRSSIGLCTSEVILAHTVEVLKYYKHAFLWVLNGPKNSRARLIANIDVR